MDRDIEMLKTRILKVISAICNDGFTTKWLAGARNYESRETFRITDDARLAAVTGEEENFVLHVEMRKADDHDKKTATRPDCCDWSLGDLVDWIQALDEDDTADLAPANMSLTPVAKMRDILATIGSDENNIIQAGGYAYRAIETNDDTGENQPIAVIARTDDAIANKWSAESFVMQGR